MYQGRFAVRNRKKKFLASHWFVEQGNSEDSEWYKIDQGNPLDSYTISLESFRSFRCCLFGKPVIHRELFFLFLTANWLQYVYLVSGRHYPQLRLDYIQYHFIREGVNKFSYNEHLHQELLKMVFTCPLILQYLVQKFRFSFLTVSYKTYKRINIATSLFADCESSFRGTTTIYSLAWLALHA